MQLVNKLEKNISMNGFESQLLLFFNIKDMMNLYRHFTIKTCFLVIYNSITTTFVFCQNFICILQNEKRQFIKMRSSKSKRILLKYKKES